MATEFTSKDKPTAVVTGASSGIGLAVSDMLTKLGYDVYGIGRHFESNSAFEFNTVVCDITDTDSILLFLKDIKLPEVFVNCAGVGYYGLHENISADNIKELLRTDLEAPMILTGAILPGFKRRGSGTIINISSVTAFKTNTYGAAYGAAKAGLSSFSDSIFEEGRKHNIKVIEIAPDMTDTNLYRNADFGVCSEPDSRLLPEDVANAVKSTLQMSVNSCVKRMIIVPQKNRIQRRSGNENRS